MKNEVKGAFCGSILLSENVWDKDQLISDLKADWGIEIPKEDAQDDDITITADIDKSIIAISKFPAPIPNQEAEVCAENNYMWPDAVKITKTHKAHILVAVIGGEEDLIAKGILYAQIMATLCKQKKAIGVFTSQVVFEPDYYLKSAQAIKEGFLPIFNWIWFGIYQTAKGLCAYTYGMDVFGKYELEILDVKETSRKLLTFICSIVEYILNENITLKDGETIGFSEDDIHQIKLSKGIAIPEKTLKISY